MRHLWLLLLLAGACGEVQKLDADSGVDADLCVGTCECVLDNDCAAAHTFCNDQVTTRTCECAAGYMPGVGGACEWAGVIADPGFQATTRWTTDADVMIDVNQNVAGMVDPGVVRFQMNGLCNLERVTQGIEMPKLSRAEPLVVVTTYRFSSSGGFDFIAAAVGVGAGWHDDGQPSFSNFVTSRFCLGSAQYAPETTKGKGAPIEVALMPARLPFGCSMQGTAFEIDHSEIKPANPGECPTPGTAANGDAEGAGGWVFSVSVANPQNPDNSTAMIEAGVGEANTHGARLFMNHRCDNVTLTNSISIPDSATLASPAISVFNRTSSTAETDWSLGGVPLPAISGSGQPATIRMCAPAFMRGGVFSVSARIESSGTCADTPNFESTFDNLKLINDPSCGTDETITDPGFESSLTLIGATANQGKSLARTLNDPTNAHGGTGVLQLSVTQLCEGPTWQANVVTPPSAAGAGPVLNFFYKATPGTSSGNHYTFSVGTSGGSFTGTLDNQYHAGKICLNPKLVGRNTPVTFSMGGGGGTCATVIPAETAFVDDLQVTTDPACPAM
jgi:hypothetical protein